MFSSLTDEGFIAVFITSDELISLSSSWELLVSSYNSALAFRHQVGIINLSKLGSNYILKLLSSVQKVNLL